MIYFRIGTIVKHQTLNNTQISNSKYLKQLFHSLEFQD